jgi:glycosyltransferase involved in cell wall biosynthesis
MDEAPLRILMVTALFPPEEFGGAPIQSLQLAKALRSKGLHVEFLTDNGLRVPDRGTYEGVPVTRVRTFFKRRDSKWREVVFATRILLFVLSRPDLRVLHFHSIRGFEAFLFPIFRLIGRRVLLKLTLAESDDPLTMRRRRLLGWAYFFGLTRVHRMAAISRRLKQMAHEAGMPEESVRLVFNGVNVDRFSPVSKPRKAEIRRKLGIGEGSVVFLSIGQIEPRKGYDLLLRAFEKIQASIQDAELMIVGPGDDEANAFYAELKAYVEERGLKRVRFAGKRADVEDYVKAADCFVFCSRQEGFGTVLIEAMACGVPTVAMNIPGITEDIITDERIGIIARAGSPGDFADAAIALLQRKNDEGLLGASAAIRSRFSIDLIADQYVSLYREMTGVS